MVRARLGECVLTGRQVFVQSVGWRWSFHFAVMVNVILCIMAVFSLPKDEAASAEGRSKWQRMMKEIDWVGAAIATISISMLSYVLA